MANNLKAIRVALGLTQPEMAQRMGTTKNQLTKLEGGDRRLTEEWIQKAASATGVAVEQFIKEGFTASMLSRTAPAGDDEPLGPNELRETTLKLMPIKVIGKLKAGDFIAIEDLGDWDESEVVYDVRDPRFPDARHFAFEVDGDSMNALKPMPIMPGARLSAISYEDVSERLPLRDGMIVAVERTRHGGLEREWSVKQLEIYDDRVEFHPRSTNPRHKPIIVKRDNNADDGVKVEIIAIIRRLVAEFNL
jgi:transcriptional regulator with XRE-family HTH domain